MYKCVDCERLFLEEDMTDEELEQGICPYCGSDKLIIAEVNEVNEDA